MARRLVTEMIVRQRIAKRLEELGVDLMFHGHDHLYHRTQPMKAGKIDPTGTTYIVTGGGGRGLYEGGKRTNSASFHLRHHALIVDLDKSQLRLKAIAEDGEILDDWTMKARR